MTNNTEGLFSFVFSVSIAFNRSTTCSIKDRNLKQITFEGCSHHKSCYLSLESDHKRKKGLEIENVQKLKQQNLSEKKI